MASFDNLEFLEPWIFRTAFAADSWMSLTDSASFSDNSLSEIFSVVAPSQTPSPSPSPSSTPSVTISRSGSGFSSEPETVSNLKRPAPAPAAGRVVKKRSRAASKKSSTTYITADASNFRQMVQQITGVSIPSSSTLLKPEPQRIGAARAVDTCLPTLDTSAFFLNHHDQQQQQLAVNHASGQIGKATATAGIGGDSGAVGGRRGLDFDSFPCFPTLESCRQ